MTNDRTTLIVLVTVLGLSALWIENDFALSIIAEVIAAVLVELLTSAQRHHNH